MFKVVSQHMPTVGVFYFELGQKWLDFQLFAQE
jgi:hypothetical protein